MRAAPTVALSSFVLLCLLAGCALLPHPKPGSKFAYIGVNDAWRFKDGGSILLSLRVQESDAVGKDWHVWLNSPLGNGRLPNRLYWNQKLVEYGSSEESTILAAVSLVAAPEMDWPHPGYIRFFENVAMVASNAQWRKGVVIGARRAEVQGRLASTNLTPDDVCKLQGEADALQEAQCDFERFAQDVVRGWARLLVTDYLEAKAHSGVMSSRGEHAPRAGPVVTGSR